jgi:hypothetical protein
LTCPDAINVIEDEEIIEIDLKLGELHCAAGSFSFPPLPEIVWEIFEAGGLIPYTRKQLDKR